MRALCGSICVCSFSTVSCCWRARVNSLIISHRHRIAKSVRLAFLCVVAVAVVTGRCDFVAPQKHSPHYTHRVCGRRNASEMYIFAHRIRKAVKVGGGHNKKIAAHTAHTYCSRSKLFVLAWNVCVMSTDGCLKYGSNGCCVFFLVLVLLWGAMCRWALLPVCCGVPV